MNVEGEQYSRYRWSQKKCDEFLLEDQSKAQLRSLSDKLSAGFVNDYVELLEALVQGAASSMCRRSRNGQNTATGRVGFLP